MSERTAASTAADPGDGAPGATVNGTDPTDTAEALDTPDAVSVVAATTPEESAAIAGIAAAERPSSGRRTITAFLRRRGPGPVGLRRRILLTFTLGSLALAAFLAVTTYGLVRSN
ncbi:MAG: hypothetical protein H0W46_08335, partial [Acidimicrobiia bacterium]|nr:hypothetical protein [Acidimicrobiia bacterium]